MSNIVNITMENVQQELLEASQSKLILIDFWADWCEPCKQLMPILEKLAGEYAGRVVFTKVNCDEQQQIASQFGIKSLPTVVLFKDGQPIDGFAGVQTETEIKATIDKHLPQPQVELFQEATVKIDAGEWAEAYGILKQVLELEPDNAQYQLTFANAAIELGKVDEVEQILQSIKLVDQDGVYHHVVAKLDLAKQAADSPEIQALQKLLAQDLDSLELKQKLAIALHQVNRNEEALDLLFSILKLDLGWGDAKKTYLDIIASLPDGDSAAGTYRRKIYALLY